ncbi:MAG: hypothetical protein AAB403_24675, partial [Planctomycetota bacterium]
MSRAYDFDLLLYAAGLAPKDPDATDTAQADSSTTKAGPGTAIEIRSGRAQLLRLVASVISLAILTDRRKISDTRKRADMYKRLIMDPKDPGKPLCLKIMFLQEPRSESNKHVGRKYYARFELPDNTSESGHTWVKGVPHLIPDGMGGRIVYGEPTGEMGPDGHPIVTGKEHVSIILLPLPGETEFRILPLGLATTLDLGTWNRIALELEEKGLPVIQQIKHGLFGRERTFFIIFQPGGFWRYMSQEDVIKKERMKKALKKSESLPYVEPTGLYNHGTIDGLKTACVENLAEYDFETPAVPASEETEAVEGTCGFNQPHVFLIAGFEETRLRLVWVGPEKGTKLVSGSMDGIGVIKVNPFAALGKSPRELDENTIPERAYALAADKLGMGNPLWEAAVEHEVLDPLETKSDTAKPILMGFAGIVIEQGRSELVQIRTTVATRLSFAGLPELEDVLGGATIQSMYWRKAGPDAMASWMEGQIEGGEFDWSSSLHMDVRRDLLAIILGKRGEATPERPKVVSARQDPRKAPRQAPGRPAPVEPKSDPVVVVAAPAEASTSDAP